MVTKYDAICKTFKQNVSPLNGKQKHLQGKKNLAWTKLSES